FRVGNSSSRSLPNWNRYTDPTSDPRPEIQQVMTDCAWFIFKNMTPQFKDGPDVRQFMVEHVGDRPLLGCYKSHSNFARSNSRGNCTASYSKRPASPRSKSRTSTISPMRRSRHYFRARPANTLGARFAATAIMSREAHRPPPRK